MSPPTTSIFLATAAVLVGVLPRSCRQQRHTRGSPPGAIAGRTVRAWCGRRDLPAGCGVLSLSWIGRADGTRHSCLPRPARLVLGRVERPALRRPPRSGHRARRRERSHVCHRHTRRCDRLDPGFGLRQHDRAEWFVFGGSSVTRRRPAARQSQRIPRGDDTRREPPRRDRASTDTLK